MTLITIFYFINLVSHIYSSIKLSIAFHFRFLNHYSASRSKLGILFLFVESQELKILW